MSLFWQKSVVFGLLLFLFGCNTTVNENQISASSPTWHEKESGIYSLQMEDILLEIDSRKGGRITQLAIGGQNLLSGPGTDSINYGSTLWLSPQNLWRWPPPTTLDSEPYAARLAGDTLHIESSVDNRFGVSFSKEIIPILGDTSLLMTYRMQNHTDSTQQYALWEVTRMLKDSQVYFFLEEDSSLRSIRESFWKINDGLVEVKVDSSDTLTNKMYANGTGWLLYRKDRLALIKKFLDLQSEELPPTHNEIEVYIDDTAYLEVEQHSSFVSLLPGQIFSWQVQWYPRQLENEQDFEKWIDKLRNEIN